MTDFVWYGSWYIILSQVSMVAADGLVPVGHQDISSHHVGL